ncbi:FHA domain-containing protein [Anaerolineales bacterium HSG25]|nr:FHA domain-containing protein [Anaerolineales bacterium HSG25]
MNKQREKSKHTYAQPPGNVSVVSVAGPDKGETVSIKKSQLKFGRSPECDIMITTGLVSRIHALLIYEDGHYVLYDENSTNGTWVNGQRVLEHYLKPDDRFQIGSSIFVLRLAKNVSLPHTPPSIPTPAGLKVDDSSSGLYSRTLADYELLDSWSGGMATVYKARSRHSGQIIALKVLKAEDPYTRDKFIKEIEVGKTLRHDHIVPVLGGGRDQGKWFMIMAFMAGKTLEKHLIKGIPIEIDFAVKVVGQMCDALSYAHQRGVYHRDIKPANILFNEDQSAMLGDFGIARLAQSVTMTAKGAILGTPQYMSYEQAVGQRADHRSDIYSLGILFYKMLTGYLPFEYKEPLRLINAHINEIPKPPSELNPDIPNHLEAVILKSMDKDVATRFQTATEMAQAMGYRVRWQQTTASLSALTMQLITAQHRVIPLDNKRIVLGRDSVNENDTEISRQHAIIHYRSGRWWLEDNDSTNGTFVNLGRISEPVMLQPGDKIRLGKTSIRVRLN